MFFVPFLILAIFLYLSLQKKKFQKNNLKIFYLILVYSFILLIPIHNYIYGNEIVLLVKSENVQNSYHVRLSDYLLLLKTFLQFEVNFELLQKILNHLTHYIKFYEFWFLIVFLNLVIVLFTNHQIKLKILALSLLFMHSTFYYF